MLTFAISAFFALALSGAILTIAAMFHAYRDKIRVVIATGLAGNGAHVPATPQRGLGLTREDQQIKSQWIKPQPQVQIKARCLPPQPLPLRAAA